MKRGQGMNSRTPGSSRSRAATAEPARDRGNRTLIRGDLRVEMGSDCREHLPIPSIPFELLAIRHAPTVHAPVQSP